MTAEHAVVRLERLIPAAPHQVYRAWLDPDLLQRWLAPGGLEVRRVEIDERVGGHYRVWQAASGSDVGGFDCELLELVPDQRIVFRWGFAGPARSDGSGETRASAPGHRRHRAVSCSTSGRNPSRHIEPR